MPHALRPDAGSGAARPSRCRRRSGAARADHENGRHRRAEGKPGAGGRAHQGGRAQVARVRGKGARVRFGGSLRRRGEAPRVQGGRGAGDPLRRPQGRPWHARDARHHRAHLWPGHGREGRAAHRRALLRRDARHDGRLRLARGRGGRPDRARQERRSHPHRRRGWRALARGAEGRAQASLPEAAEARSVRRAGEICRAGRLGLRGCRDAREKGMSLDLVDAGRDLPENFNVVIEIPMNAEPVKYEVDKETGAIFVDRVLTTPMRYPCNYGYVPRTLSRDGDPVDVLVVMPLPLLPGCVIRCRPVGMLAMRDEAGEDTKVLAVPLDEVFPAYRAVREVRDLPELTLERIVHFFEHYKDPEKGKWVKVQGWQDASAARREIVEAVKRFTSLPPKERPPF